MIIFLAGLTLGWALGAGYQWWYFHSRKLIRSREEWYKAKGHI